MNLFPDHVQAKAGAEPIFGTFFWPLSRKLLFGNDPDFGSILVFLGGIAPGNDFLPLAEKNILWLSAEETNLRRVG